MTRTPKRPRDPNQLAKLTGAFTEEAIERSTQEPS
jgi:hypothetical protein